MRFSPLRLSHRLRRHRPPLLNSYPSFKTHPQSAQPKPTPLLPAPPVYCTPRLPATPWAGNRPPASSPLAPAAHGGTTDSVRAESKLRAFLLPLELPVQYLVHGSCSMRLNWIIEFNHTTTHVFPRRNSLKPQASHILSLKEPKVCQVLSTGAGGRLLNLFSPSTLHLKGSHLHLRDYLEEEWGKHLAYNNWSMSSQTLKTSWSSLLASPPLLLLTPQSTARWQQPSLPRIPGPVCPPRANALEPQASRPLPIPFQGFGCISLYAWLSPLGCRPTHTNVPWDSSIWASPGHLHLSPNPSLNSLSPLSQDTSLHLSTYFSSHPLPNT